MGGKPDLLVVIDTNKEHIAISEAKKLGIPVVAIVDTNSDPDQIDFPVPGNDDAIRSITFYCSQMMGAALAGIEDALAAAGVDIGESETTPSQQKAHSKRTHKVRHQNQRATTTKENVNPESIARDDEFSSQVDKA